jgi:hypothetical protein
MCKSKTTCFLLTIKIFFLLSIICSMRTHVFARQDELAPYNIGIPPRPIIPMKTPQAISRQSVDKISNFVLDESLRYKRKLHPAFLRIDSAKNTADDLKEIDENPYVLLNAHLKGYKYAPVFRIENVRRSGLGYFRNLFAVRIFDRFIRPESVEKNIAADTILASQGLKYNNWAASTIVPFFWNDGFFTLYYCPVTNDLRMVGGHAFLDQFPDDALYDGSIDYNAEIVALSRMIHFPGYHPASAPLLTHSYNDLDSLRRKLYEDRKYIYFNHTPYSYMDEYPKRLIVVRIPKYGYKEITTTSDCIDCKQKIKTIPPEPWDNLELILYLKDQSEFLGSYPKGFTYYEIKHIIRNKPENFNDVQAIIRGVEQAEISVLKAKKFILD